MHICFPSVKGATRLPWRLRKVSCKWWGAPSISRASICSSAVTTSALAETPSVGGMASPRRAKARVGTQGCGQIFFHVCSRVTMHVIGHVCINTTGAPCVNILANFKQTAFTTGVGKYAFPRVKSTWLPGRRPVQVQAT